MKSYKSMWISIFLLVLTIILVACAEYTKPNSGFGERKTNYTSYNKLVVYSACSDSVVCYYHHGYNAGGMDCFRDKDLLEKYC